MARKLPMLISSLKFRPVADRLKQIISWVTLLFSLIGCGDSLISVSEISQQKVDKTVQLTGKVVHLAPLLDRTAYQIEDGTGKIWVVTTQNPPQSGKSISIKGKIQYQSLPFAQQELGELYLVELEQLPISSAEK